jgi:hypothetical protein
MSECRYLSRDDIYRMNRALDLWDEAVEKEHDEVARKPGRLR